MGTTQGSLSNTTWFRVYRFDAYAGDSVTIDMDDASGGNLDPYLFLLDEAENVIASDDDGGGTYNASLVTGLPQTGTYYIVATRFMLNLPGDETTPNEGPFTLRLTGSRAPTSQTAAAATARVVAAVVPPLPSRGEFPARQPRPTPTSTRSPTS